MHKIACLLGCSLILFSCAHRALPVYNAEINVPAAVQMESIPKSIKSALIEHGWTIQKDDANLIESTIRVRSHSAEIRIPYNKESIRIQYVSSDNYLYSQERDIPIYSP